MQEWKFEKKCNPVVLQEELKEARFEVLGVSTENGQTIIHLIDTETKDPTPIVEAHVYKEFDAEIYAKNKPSDLQDYQNVLEEVARALGLDPTKIESYPQTRTPEEIITDWLRGHWRYQQEWADIAKAIEERRKIVEAGKRS